MAQSTKRSLQIAELIWRALASLLRQYMREPLLNSVIVTHVKVTNDLSRATVFFTLLNKNELNNINTLFSQETKRLKGMIAKKINLRYMPEMRFIYDSFSEKKEKLLNLINHLPSDHEKQDHE